MSESGYNQGVNNQGVTTKNCNSQVHRTREIARASKTMDEQQYIFMDAIKERKIYQETDVALIKRKVCELAEHMRFMRIEIEKVRIQHEKEREEDRQLHEKDREEDRQTREKDREEDRQTREKDREEDRQTREKEREKSRQQHEKDREEDRQQHEKDREEDRQRHEKEREEDRIRSEADSAKRDRQYHHLKDQNDELVERQKLGYQSIYSR